MHRGVDVGRRQAVAGRPVPVDQDLQRRLAERAKRCQVGDARNGLECSDNLIGGFFQNLQVGAENLHRIFALDTRGSLLDVVFDVLRKAEFNTREALLQLARHLGNQRLLFHPWRPLPLRLQGHKKLSVEEPRCIRPIGGTPMLRNRGLHFGVAADQAAHLVDVAVAFFQRNRQRHGGANPQVALLQLGQKFKSQP